MRVFRKPRQQPRRPRDLGRAAEGDPGEHLAGGGAGLLDEERDPPLGLGENFHAILLNRKGRPEDRSHPLQGVFDTLASGRSIIIFPEGTRSLDGTLQKFKPGIFHLKERFPESAMFPISLQNLNRILPKGQSLPVPLIGRITVHPPLADIAGESREDFLARARAAVASGLHRNQCDE